MADIFASNGLAKDKPIAIYGSLDHVEYTANLFKKYGYNQILELLDW